MRVLHVTPSHFGDSSVIGGAERYAWELARAMARDTDVVFFALADRPLDRRDGRLHVIHAPGRPLLNIRLRAIPSAAAWSTPFARPTSCIAIKCIRFSQRWSS